MKYYNILACAVISILFTTIPAFGMEKEADIAQSEGANSESSASAGSGLDFSYEKPRVQTNIFVRPRAPRTTPYQQGQPRMIMVDDSEESRSEDPFDKHLIEKCNVSPKEVQGLTKKFQNNKR
jgi:hypothetical protein